MPGFVGAVKDSYGWTHQQARAQAFKLLPTWSPCSRCGHLMYKWSRDQHGASALHYDHNDSNTNYLGFSHAQCNRKDGARKGQKAQAQHRKQGTPTHRRTHTSGGPGIGW